MDKTWRERAAPIIAQVLADNQGADEKTMRKALSDSYPFGQKKYFPYKIWCDEVQRQRGIVKMTALRRRQLAQIKAHNASLFAEQD